MCPKARCTSGICSCDHLAASLHCHQRKLSQTPKSTFLHPLGLGDVFSVAAHLSSVYEALSSITSILYTSILWVPWTVVWSSPTGRWKRATTIGDRTEFFSYHFLFPVSRPKNMLIKLLLFLFFIFLYFKEYEEHLWTTTQLPQTQPLWSPHSYCTPRGEREASRGRCPGAPR